MSIADQSIIEESDLSKHMSPRTNITEQVDSDKTVVQLQNLDKEDQTFVVEEENCTEDLAIDTEKNDIEEYSIKVISKYREC